MFPPDTSWESIKLIKLDAVRYPSSEEQISVEMKVREEEEQVKEELVSRGPLTGTLLWLTKNSRMDNRKSAIGVFCLCFRESREIPKIQHKQ